MSKGYNVSIEDLTVIMANQNHCIRNAFKELISSIGSVAAAAFFFLAISIIGAIAVMVCVSLGYFIAAGIVAAITLVLMIIASIVPLTFISSSLDRINDLHEQCTDLEAARLAGDSEK